MYSGKSRVEGLHRQFEELKCYYSGKLCSVLLIDPMGRLPIDELAEGEPRGLYVDLSDLASRSNMSSPDECCSTLLTEGYQGVILDNADRIANTSQRRDWEYFVKWSLKRETHCPIYSGATQGQSLDFSQIAVAVRCRDYPTYLRQADLLAYIIKV